MAVVSFPMVGLTQWKATTHLGEGLVLRLADFSPWLLGGEADHDRGIVAKSPSILLVLLP